MIVTDVLSVRKRFASLPSNAVEALDAAPYALPIVTPDGNIGISPIYYRLSSAALRTELYARLVNVANAWSERLHGNARFPKTLDAFTEVSLAAGQTRLTPLILTYGVGDQPSCSRSPVEISRAVSSLLSSNIHARS